MVSLALSPSKSLGSHNPIPGGCLMYWPLWALGGGVIKSVDPFGRIGTATSTAVKVSKGRDFLGASGSTIALTTDIFTQADFAGGLSMGCWFKADTVDDAGQILLTLEDRAYLSIVATTDLLNFGIYDGATQSAVGDGAISVATWYCVFGTWNATTMTLYQGSTAAPVAQAITDTATVPIFDAASRPSAIGSARDASANFDGIIGDSWVYNRALSVSEIGHIYDRTKGRYS